MEELFKKRLCGIYAGDGAKVYLWADGGAGARRMEEVEFRPYAWSSRACLYPDSRPLNRPSASSKVEAPLESLLVFADSKSADDYMKNRPRAFPFFRLSSLENQFMCEHGMRMFAEMRFDEIRRIQLDIEVYSQDDSFPNAFRHSDRIIAVGISGFGGERLFEIADLTDEAEAALLREVGAYIAEVDPDLIAGHNIFKFDLPYIEARSKRLKVPMNWGRGGFKVQFRKSRLSIAERIFQYTRCDIPGRTVVDTLLLVQFYDITARSMESYTLKSSAVHFGISEPQNRTYIEGSKIKNVFFEDRQTFRKYLRDDLRETDGLCAHLLPTYVAQARNFPMTMQECLLRGNGMKVESLFIEEYFRRSAALPMAPQQSARFEGAISEGFEIGLFKNVLHYDVASLYPSLMLFIGECPHNDYLNIFLKKLSQLREYRLKYKKMAKEAVDADDKLEYDARQKSFKILINSFYGYLGLSTAIFGDVELASKVTAAGRELLGRLIDKFRELGVKVLEADTDGIYVEGGKYFGVPEELLSNVSQVLPDGVDLEFDGAYSAMLCYKAKNYALLENGREILRGSAFRNRATEPFLRKLTHTMILDTLLERADRIPDLIESTRRKIISGEADIKELCKSEFITKSPSAYQKEVAETGKGRRAALEAALLMKPMPTSGEKVSYYICKLDGKKNPDWKCARPVELYDRENLPYDAQYYLKKIDDWQKRFAELSGAAAVPEADSKPSQAELF